jgi:hypothetical protein
MSLVERFQFTSEWNNTIRLVQLSNWKKEKQAAKQWFKESQW